MQVLLVYLQPFWCNSLLKYVSQPAIAKNSLKPPILRVQGQSRSSMFTFLRSFMPVLVTISSMFMPIFLILSWWPDWPWTLKIRVFSDIWWFLAAKKWIATKWIKIDQDYLRTGTVCTIQKTSTISTRILNTFAGSLLDVCCIDRVNTPL